MGAIGRRPAEGVSAVSAEVPENDLLESFGSGLVRGTSALLDLPGAAISGTKGLVDSYAGDQFRENFNKVGRSSPMMTLLGGGDIASNAAETVFPGAQGYEPQTTAGEYAQTVGEFLPATVGGGVPAAIKGGVVPALASEAAGQATEGTAFEDAARLIGAVAAPTMLQGASNRVQSLFAKSQANPITPNLKAVKQAAYKQVDDMGAAFSAKDTDDLYAQVRNIFDDGNYVSGVDKQSDAVLALLEKKAGSEMTLSQLDKIRQNLFKRYDAAKNETHILDAIDAVDDLIRTRGAASDAMNAARVANARFKKAELLDLAFQKADDQVASTGSGGNVMNKYKQAVTSIINNPRQAKWFHPSEIDMMRAFVRGTMSENVMRRVGKLAPGGNGLMLALNLGAAAVEPSMLAVTAGATASKALADRKTIKGAEDLMRTVGGVPRSKSSKDLVNTIRAGISAGVQ